MAASSSFARLPFSFDVQELREDLRKINPDDWIDHVNKRDYAGSWQVLPLRSLAVYKNAHPIMQGFAIESGPSADEWCDLPALLNCSGFQSVLHVLQCPIKSVRLMRLNVAASILPHRDYGVAIEHGEARLHLPIETDPKLQFVVNGLIVPMLAGELWYINADQTHSVINAGSRDRVNMVIDCIANDWLCNVVANSEWPCSTDASAKISDIS